MTDFAQKFFKLRTVGGRAGDFFFEHALASCRLQVFELGAEVSGVSRDAGIARSGSVCLNSRLAAAKWISAMVMLQPRLAAAQ
jgi:hypothetical protein